MTKRFLNIISVGGGIEDTVTGEVVKGSRIGDLLNQLNDENEQLKKENQRMTDKLNELALEFLNYDMVSMGKATEISEMCYYDFLKYRKDNGNPMELQL